MIFYGSDCNFFSRFTIDHYNYGCYIKRTGITLRNVSFALQDLGSIRHYSDAIKVKEAEFGQNAVYITKKHSLGKFSFYPKRHLEFVFYKPERKDQPFSLTPENNAIASVGKYVCMMFNSIRKNREHDEIYWRIY